MSSRIELEVLRQREVERLLLVARRAATQSLRIVDDGERGRTDPDAGAHADPLHVGGESRHVGELRDVALCPRPARRRRSRRPSRVDHAVRAVRVARRDLGEEGRVAAHRVGVEVLAVRVVPVVVAADRRARQARVQRQQLAEATQRGEGRERASSSSTRSSPRRSRGRRAGSAPPPFRKSSQSDVPCGVDRPEAERRRLRHHAVHHGASRSPDRAPRSTTA